MSRKFFAIIAALPLVACGLEGADTAETESETVARADTPDFGYETAGEDNYADTMASNDEAYLAATRSGAAMNGESEAIGAGSDSANANDVPDPRERPIMHAQVVLDRQGFGPGVIDGAMGQSTRNAIKGFQEANDLEVTGELDDATKQALNEWERIPATRVVTIPASWANLEFTEIPDDPAEQAAMERMSYESLDEKVAERFHTTVAVLEQLNPNGKPEGAPSASASPTPRATQSAQGSTATNSVFRAGQQIRVPNIGADRISPGAIQDRGWQQTLASLGVGSDQPEVTRVVVDESEGWLKGFDAQGKLVAMFTVTTGSENDPLPVGDWGVTGIAYNPPFSYQPELFWDVPDTEEEQQLPPGPNGPVGVVWIDLTKEHYGIHGTSAPETIGSVESHGCVRLTNWDAARLAGMVNTDTEVLFQR
ncbi:L,D-transpeptidase family protein [Erythrobacter alti]|uniref:L,D-transpeptidase family protein n=1 Tax=Erythrobacter alti TaxID=1896145 RepID=UPI0030F4A1FF